jgi:hypothetical protein
MRNDSRNAGRAWRRRAQLSCACLLPGLAAAALMTGAGAATSLPEIRTSAHNPVPACVTPDRLMAFLKSRNPSLPARYRGIAGFYKSAGETWHVRWDYAFFQMAVETNFLSYRRPDGRMGDVDPKQNNFAGIGTTGGGVPGDSFPDIKTGVLGQIQHLVVYSGETVAQPVAQRTQLKQEHILTKSRELNRPVRFSDLAKRWAADPKYGASIEWVADNFRSEYCRGGGKSAQQQEVLPWANKAPAPHADAGSDLGAATDSVISASEPIRGDDGETAAAPAAAGSPAVRTVWSKDKAKAAQPGGALRASAPPVKTAQAKVLVAPVPKKIVTQPVAATSQTGDAFTSGQQTVAAELVPAPSPPQQPESQPQPTYQTAGVTEAVAPATTPEPQPVEQAESGGFAFLSPPALFAGAAPQKAGFQPPSGLGFKPDRCIVEAASFGGTKAVLVRAPKGTDVHYIALSVLEGFETSMTESFIRARPEGGDAVGEFASRDEALAKARELCSQH